MDTPSDSNDDSSASPTTTFMQHYLGLLWLHLYGEDAVAELAGRRLLDNLGDSMVDLLESANEELPQHQQPLLKSEDM